MAKLNSNKIAVIGHIGASKISGIEIAESLRNNKNVIIVANDNFTPAKPTTKEREPIFFVPEMPFIEPLTRKERRKRERRNKKR
jgi:hypothetical protein